MDSKNSLYSVTISQLAERITSCIVLNNNLIITSDVKSCMDSLCFPLRVEAIVVGVCLKGNMKISVNMKDFMLAENTCVFSLPENTIGISEVSDDCEGAIVAISMNYLRSMNIDLKSILPYYAIVRVYPCISVGESDMAKLKQLYQLIIDTLSDKESHRKEDIVKSLFAALVFKCCEQMDKTGFRGTSLKNKSKEYYFIRFMELLQSDFRICRKVEYYSDRLGITPKYLSGLIKTISGASAAGWIDEYTITEASVLLRFSDKTIQQIADDLNFPSQSFFSKYFKQHTGHSPSEFRNSTLSHESKTSRG